MKSFFIITFSLMLIGCASPLTTLKENQVDKINYAYSTKNSQEVANCLKIKWQTRDIHAFFRTYQFEPLIETQFPKFIRLTFSNTVVFDIFSGVKTEIREVHQEDVHYIMKGVIKDVMIKCSDSQNFTNLISANEKVMSTKD